MTISSTDQPTTVADKTAAIPGDNCTDLSSGRNPTTISGYDIVRCVLGLVLSAASLAKFYAALTGPTDDGTFLNARWFLIGLAVFEAVLGLGLLAAIRPRWTHRLALACFTVFLVVVALRGFTGEPSCGGCAGKIPVTPWQAAVFDLGAIVALLIWRPRSNQAVDSLSLAVFAPYVVGAAIMLALLAGWVYYQLGSISAALAQLRGDSIAVVAPSLDAGERSRGDVAFVTVDLLNLTDYGIAILGARSCGANATIDLPITIPARTKRTIRVQLAFIGDHKTFTRQVLLFTDDKNQPNVVFWVSGRIRANE